jgi:hypothetical protein
MTATTVAARRSQPGEVLVRADSVPRGAGQGGSASSSAAGGAGPRETEGSGEGVNAEVGGERRAGARGSREPLPALRRGRRGGGHGGAAPGWGGGSSQAADDEWFLGGDKRSEREKWEGDDDDGFGWASGGPDGSPISTWELSTCAEA